MTSDNSNLHTIIYVSQSTADHNSNELVALLKQSRKRNSELEITGMLVYVPPTFIQILEGPMNAVRSLYYDKITHDRRHRNVRTIRDESLPERTFGEWLMAFRQADNDEQIKIDGFSGFLNSARAYEKGQEPPEVSLPMLRALQRSLGN